MKRAIRLVLPAATLLVAFLATNGLVFATKEMAKKEKKACTTCHEKGTPNKDNLNDVGKYYKAKKTLDGAPVPAK
jgi:cytochrome c551/c552